MKPQNKSGFDLPSSGFDSDLSGLIAEINRAVPGFRAEAKLGNEDWFCVALPVPPGAEYKFEAHIQIKGERQISAKLLGREDDLSFWYLALELAAFRQSPQEVAVRFFEILDVILRCETRILQHHGLLCESFKCEYREGQQWERIGGLSVFRAGGFKTPQIKGRRRLYHSPALKESLVH